jgi:hypothetical protein
MSEPLDRLADFVAEVLASELPQERLEAVRGRLRPEARGSRELRLDGRRDRFVRP